MTIKNILPCNIEAEEGVIVHLLNTPSHMVHVTDMLKPDDFYRDVHSLIYGAIERVYVSGKMPNLLNVVYDLRKRDELETIGGEGHLHFMVNELLVLTDIEDHVSEVKRTSTLRKIIRACADVVGKAYAQDDDTVELAAKIITDITLGNDSDSVADTQTVGTDYLEELKRRRYNFQHNIVNGIPTGFVDLDHLLGGLQKGDLIIIAARPAFGKTSLALNIGFNIVHRAKHVLVFSMEMTKQSLYQRLISMETPIDQSFLRDGDISDDEWGRIVQAKETLDGVDLKMDDRTRTLAAIRSKAIREHAKKPLDVIIIDYLQLIQVNTTGRGRNETRAEEIGTISRHLKTLAIELNIPILVLAQLNRAVESRRSPVPLLSDLAEGSGIEKDADIISFLYATDEQLQERNLGKSYRVTLNVSKHRNGPVGEIELVFKPRLTKFVDVSLEEAYTA